MALGLQDPWLAKRMGLSADSACARVFVVHPHPGCVSKTSRTRVYDAAGDVIETHEHIGEVKEP